MGPAAGDGRRPAAALLTTVARLGEGPVPPPLRRGTARMGVDLNEQMALQVAQAENQGSPRTGGDSLERGLGSSQRHRLGSTNGGFVDSTEVCFFKGREAWSKATRGAQANRATASQYRSRTPRPPSTASTSHPLHGIFPGPGADALSPLPVPGPTALAASRLPRTPSPAPVR